MSVTMKTENGTPVLNLSGRITSANAAEAEQQANAALGDYSGKALTLDLNDLEYISSAGLRVLLRLRKRFAGMEMVNVSSDVYEVFEMTGFTEMMPISKAYRRISVEGCEVIGQGANGEVYRIDPDTIVVLGVPTAIPYDVVRVGEGYGSVFELLNATSFSKLIAADPDGLEGYVRQFVDLMKLIHDTTVKPGVMPQMRDVALDWADFLRDYLPQEKWQKLHDLVAAVPEQLTMLHGDYHTKNVMLQNGEVILIDMDTLCTGHPVFELASVYNAFVGFSELDESVAMKFQGIPAETCRRIWELVLEMYFDDADEETRALHAKQAMLIGYTRLMRRRIRRGGLEDPVGQKEIACYKQHILELLDQVDRLDW